MKTLVLGASPNPNRYAYKAVLKLQEQNVDVVALGIKAGTINNLDILLGKPALEDIHTITLYINSKIQQEYYDYLLALQPKRIIFNPGTENVDFYGIIKRRAPNISIEPACTLVMLATGAYFS